MNCTITINYKLNASGVKQLAHLLHEQSTNYEFINNIINYYTLEALINTKNNGLISNILSFYMNTKNDIILTQIIPYINQLNNFKLMKRDYMNFINYYYINNYSQAELLFTQYILNNSLNITPCSSPLGLQMKDINFILNNKLFKLLPYLLELFIEVDNSEFPLINPININLKKININLHLLTFLINKIETEFNNIILKQINSFHTKLNEIKVIIDGGNILHNRQGNITQQSLIDLENIIINVITNIGTPLIIIHSKHFKTHPELINIFTRTGVIYYRTPYNINDDLFIIWFFLKYNCEPYIISNDKYRDHIFKFNTLSKNQSNIPNNDLNIFQFKNIIKQQTLQYNTLINEIQKPVNWSFCIQLIDNNIYIPHVSGNFIQI
jgi:hypothetical protein